MAWMMLPGYIIGRDELPVPGRSLHCITIGPGLTHTAPASITATASGTLVSDARKNTAWIEGNGRGRYVPSVGDVVLATVHRSGAEFFSCAIAPFAPLATLDHLAFEGVSRKTRPQLQTGSVVYARVASVPRELEPELTCVHPSSGKSEGMGELKGGMLFDVSLGLARRLLTSKAGTEGRVALLDQIGEKGLSFELAAGRNGKVWVRSASVNMTLAIGRGLQEVDQNILGVAEQEKLARRVVRDSQS